MKLFNTLSRTVEEFKPIRKGHVRLYTCGPTVYNYVHIGNLRTFTFEDLLRRWLEYRGYAVLHAKNLTDVDDKTIRDSQKEDMSLKAFTERYTDAFYADSDALNIQRAHVYPKATDHIAEMVLMIQDLLDKGLAYKAEDGIYFSVKKFNGYGKLAHISPEQLEAGASGRVKKDEYDKENASDFALWKFWDETDGDVFWETPLGKGRPGWHIECSAMSAKHLTNLFHDDHLHTDGFETIDIHTGGIDLIFPHHDDEIAQTEGCVGKPFAKYWLHAEHLLVDGKKMSKSLKNFYTLRDIDAKKYSPLALRYLFISSHYRQQLNFTWEALDAASVAVQRFNDFYLRLRETETIGQQSDDHAQYIGELIDSTRRQFIDLVDNDLNMSPALAVLFDFMTTINIKMDDNGISQDDAKQLISFMRELDTVLGILLPEEEIPPEVAQLLAERETARRDKDFKKSDELRDTLKTYNIAVEDTPHGQRWKRILS